MYTVGHERYLLVFDICIWIEYVSLPSLSCYFITNLTLKYLERLLRVIFVNQVYF